MAPASLVDSYRRSLQQLTGMAERDLQQFWRQVEGAIDTRDGLIELLPRLVAMYGSAAATLAADWYDDVRAAEQARGRFRAIPAELPDSGRTDALARWAVTPLFAATPDAATALVKVAGGLQRIVADAGRGTVLRSAAADPAAAGWSRSTSGSGCDFCRMIAGRGAVYSAATADFDSHDHCHCVAVPVYGGSDRAQTSTPS